MKCQNCGSKYASRYEIRLEVTAPRKKGFKATVQHCDKCMLPWYETIGKLTTMLPDGCWEKWGGK